RVSGPGVEAHAARLPPGLDLVEPELRLPRPESLLRLALARYRAGERDDMWKLEPIYLRPSAAEEQWRRMGRGGCRVGAIRTCPPLPGGEEVGASPAAARLLYISTFMAGVENVRFPRAGGVRGLLGEVSCVA